MNTQSSDKSRRNFCNRIVPTGFGTLLAGYLAPGTLGAQKRDASLGEIRRTIDHATANGELPGIVALVQDGGAPPHIEAAGLKDVERRERMHTNTVFDLRSITKTITAMATMLLVSDRRLSLDEDIGRYLPSSSGATGDRNTEDAWPITVRHLLTHTSGLSPLRPASLARLTESRDVPLSTVVNQILEVPRSTAAGSLWAYSSPGYAVLGRVVEVASGELLDSFVGRRILAPLRMHDTTFNPVGKVRERLASLYQTKDGRLLEWPRTLPVGKWPYIGPDFGLYSTAADVARFLASMLPGARCLLPEELRRMMLTATVNTDVTGLKQGLGWMVTDADDLCKSMGISDRCFGHNGAFGSMVWANARQQRVVVFLTQCLHNSSLAGASVLRAALCNSGPN